MLTISHEHYTHLSELLLEKISDHQYYSGTIEFQDEATLFKFSSSLIIYRQKCTEINICANRISDIVPIWWELKCFTNLGKQLNDFDFQLLKNYFALE